jgi:hypothetical protein
MIARTLDIFSLCVAQVAAWVLFGTMVAIVMLRLHCAMKSCIRLGYGFDEAIEALPISREKQELFLSITAGMYACYI